METLFWEIAESVVEQYRTAKTVPDEIHDLKDSLGDQFLCNFSVFQSLLDHWALGQLFPIAPIHRLNEAPVITGSAARNSAASCVGVRTTFHSL